MTSQYGQLKQKITLSLTPYCMANLSLITSRNRKNSISDMFEQLVRGNVNTDLNYEPTDDEIIAFMVRYKPKEIRGFESHEIAPHFRKIYFTDHTPPNDISELI